jgi:surface antigen
LDQHGIAFLMIGTTLTGCESTDGLNKEQMGTGLGTAVGGAVGSLFGEGSSNVVTVALGTTVGGVLGNQIGRKLDQRDKAAIEQETARALEEADDGETVVWNNPESGASAEMTPRATRTVEKQVAVVRSAEVAPPPTLELIGKPYQARQDANVRAAPTKDAQVVAGLRRGETINAVGRVEGRDWYMVARDAASATSAAASLHLRPSPPRHSFAGSPLS